jgi:hypothetical protein
MRQQTLRRYGRSAHSEPHIAIRSWHCLLLALGVVIEAPQCRYQA